ncbi:Membrane-bound lytic murein transglycosylase A precursor [hydrothermal vent metagenome]|uniref:peptidoglycan lytic exotransglycosylase n=1 Tax=hydrothermal vent metagenome TaxID=652676 RepID=A0A3B0VQI6_9ZZZZ
MNNKFLLPVAVFILLLVSGCRPRLPGGCRLRALKTAPDMVDDGSRASLEAALTNSIAYWRRRDGAARFKTCGAQSVTAGDMLASLLKFRKLLHTLPDIALPDAVAANFKVCQAQNSRGGDDILVTGYYQPVFQGSLIKQPPFIYPIYGLPPDLIKARHYGAAGSGPFIGRLEDNRLLPYWRRAAIEDKQLLAGDELLYLRDPVDVFILQVQGSGLIRLPDGRLLRAGYAGSNGRDYKSIGRLLVDEGKIPLKAVSMEAIRAYLASHLDERRRILHYNDRYIFFRLEDDPAAGPVGSMGKALTAGRSAALDSRCFPMGGLYYLETTVPEFAHGRLCGRRPLRRFVLQQDSGAAIKGSGRLDLFMGTGAEAAATAGYMKEAGRLYLLMPK